MTMLINIVTHEAMYHTPMIPSATANKLLGVMRHSLE
jgi:hypothetical protein